MLWDLLRGAAQLKQPGRGELAKRYAEVLADNLGQPGFRELVIVAHDLDAHCDLVFALVAERRRRDLFRRPTAEAAELRRAELIDLSGVGPGLPGRCGRRRRWPCRSRPIRTRSRSPPTRTGAARRTGSAIGRRALVRLLDELVGLGVQQILIVSARPNRRAPTRSPRPASTAARGWASTFNRRKRRPCAMRRDASPRASPRVFTIRPSHNPIGPFDFGGGYDDRSDRRQPLDELMSRGYEDAYHQFIEPVVGASGERVGLGS